MRQYYHIYSTVFLWVCWAILACQGSTLDSWIIQKQVKMGQHRRTQNMPHSSSDWSAGDKREARAHWPAVRERRKPIGQLGVTKRTAVTAAWRWVVHLPRMQRKQCLQVLQPVAWSKQTVYLYGAAPAATTACLIGNELIASLSWADIGFTYKHAHTDNSQAFSPSLRLSMELRCD